MAGDFIRIHVEGLDDLTRAMNKFPRESKRYLNEAGKEAASRVILPTEGLKKYPPAGPANQPPFPFYERGRGTWYSAERNSGKSERLGTQFYVKNAGYGTEIGNRASYARWVVGEEQARHMASKGWRKLRDVVEEKMEDITKVYQAWVDKLLQDIGLK